MVDSKAFVPTKQIAVLIASCTYNRNVMPTCQDIPEAKDDITFMKGALAKFGFTEVFSYVDPSKITLDILFNGLSRTVLQSNTKGVKICIFVYYSGHGAMED